MPFNLNEYHENPLFVRGQEQFQENLYVIDENAEGDEEDKTSKMRDSQLKEKQVHQSFIFDEDPAGEAEELKASETLPSDYQNKL